VTPAERRRKADAAFNALRNPDAWTAEPIARVKFTDAQARKGAADACDGTPAGPGATLLGGGR
jgi:hypothetical protein